MPVLSASCCTGVSHAAAQANTATTRTPAPRRTRTDRAFAFTYKQGLWLAEMPPPTAATVRAISSQFARAGTEALETAAIFSTPEVVKAGGLTALKMLGEPNAILLETKERLFAA